MKVAKKHNYIEEVLLKSSSDTIDYDKEVLLIRVLYIRTDFDNERIYRVKNYIYLDNTLYQNNNDIKRVPREVRLLLEDYFQDVNISIKVNLPEN